MLHRAIFVRARLSIDNIIAAKRNCPTLRRAKNSCSSTPLERLRNRYEAHDPAAKGHLQLRFDDSLDTVLTAEMSTPFGAQTAWRQLVDLIGRGRAPATQVAMSRLRSIRSQVPAATRAASARALAFARPPAALVRLFAEEDLPIAAPVLRMAELSDTEWIDIMPDISPAGRSVLRHRRDLSGEVQRALESYGPSDFILPPEPVQEPVAVEPEPASHAPIVDDAQLIGNVIEVVGATDAVEPEMAAPTDIVEPVEAVDAVEVFDVIVASATVVLADEAVAPVDSAAPVESVALSAEPELKAVTTDGDDAPIAEVEPARAADGAMVAQPVATDEPLALAAIEPVEPVDAPATMEPDASVAFTAQVAAEAIAESDPKTEQELDAPVAAVPPPLSIDWTEVLRARPPVPGSPKPVLDEVRPASPERQIVPQEERAAVPEPAPTPVGELSGPVSEPASPEPAFADGSGFVSLASVAFGLPVVQEAMRQHQASDAVAEDIIAADPAPEVQPSPVIPAEAIGEVEPEPMRAQAVADPLPEPIPEPGTGAVAETTAEPVAPEERDPVDAAPVARGPFQISDLVARIDAFNRQREEEGRADTPPMLPNDINRPVEPKGFRFETDAQGVIRWVAGISRGAVIGMTLNQHAAHAETGVDGGVAGAFRRRAAFSNARMLVPGGSDAAGQWRISGLPSFDPASGRFTGYRGTARRPRKDECAEPGGGSRSSATDSLRELVHELRTPTTAIAGFAEMIEGQLLGPVANAYRDYAGTIREQARDLLGAIDDLDTAARIEAHALELRPAEVAVAPLFGRIARDLEPLAKLRGAGLAVAGAESVSVRGDDRAVERLVGRLMAALISATATGETLRISVAYEGEETVAISAVRPSGLAAYADDATASIDAEAEAEAEGAPLLGTGFALRLARNLASELGGSLSIGADRLTLRLPAAFTLAVDQASTF